MAKPSPQVLRAPPRRINNYRLPLLSFVVVTSLSIFVGAALHFETPFLLAYAFCSCHNIDSSTRTGAEGKGAVGSPTTNYLSIG